MAIGVEGAVRAQFQPEAISFTGEADGDVVRLHWSTASEHNSAWFFVERADDQGGFTLIAQVPAAGFSQHQLNYVAEDRFPLEGTAYYRLREQDLDGSELTGPLVAVDRTSLAGTLRPIQGSSAVLIATAEAGGQWNLFDTAGRLRASGQLGGGQVRVEVPDGLSLLEVASPGGRRLYRVGGAAEGALIQEVL